jgi:hypothetical protein
MFAVASDGAARMPATPQARRRHPWGRARLWSSRAQRRHPDDPRLLRPCRLLRRRRTSCSSAERTCALPVATARTGCVRPATARPTGSRARASLARGSASHSPVASADASTRRDWPAGTGPSHGCAACLASRRSVRVRFPSPALKRCLRVDLPHSGARQAERSFVNSAPRGVAQSGSAFGWGPKGRWFKSSRPD